MCLLTYVVGRVMDTERIVVEPAFSLGPLIHKITLRRLVVIVEAVWFLVLINMFRWLFVVLRRSFVVLRGWFVAKVLWLVVVVVLIHVLRRLLIF